MPSNLRQKLKAISAVPPKPAHEAGLLVYESVTDVPQRLLQLSGTGLRRIGYEGERFDPLKCLFLDTETTGLSGGAGTIAFLVGVGFLEMRGEKCALRVQQYLMRDYSDEYDLLDRIAVLLDRYETICTFNGRRFDVPLLQTRFTMNRMGARRQVLDDLDLLYPARRTWKLRLGSCRLGRIEEFILGQPREDDIPGAEIPQRWFDFLKSGDMNLLKDIVEHNRKDIATLALLLDALAALYDAPEQTEDREDLYSLGKAMEHQGEFRLAKRLYRKAAVPTVIFTAHGLRAKCVESEANWRLYLLLRKEKRTGELRPLLEHMLRRGQMPFEVSVELSKLCEHVEKNDQEALRHALKAADACPERQVQALQKRIARLKRKINPSSEDDHHGIHGPIQTKIRCEQGV